MDEAPEGSNGQQGQGRALGQQPGSQRQNYTSQFVVGAQRVAEPKETDPHRIAQRQKQIDYGKNTLGYQRYTEEVPRYLRRKISTRIAVHPDTPDVTQICSKRSFDGQAKKWRRELHLWDPVEDKDLLDPVMMAQATDSPEASVGTRGSVRTNTAAVAGWPEPQARLEAPPEDSASEPEPEDEKPEDEEPTSMFSPKKQRGENGRAIPQQLLPSRLGGAASQEPAARGSAGSRPPGTGSKRRYHDMSPEPAQASRDPTYPLAAAATDFLDDEEPAPWSDLSHNHQNAAAGNNEQSDNIFGPAHEFD